MEGDDDADDQGQEVTYEEVADGDYNPYDDFLIDQVSQLDKCVTSKDLYCTTNLSLSC
jgi:hypothetical protein